MTIHISPQGGRDLCVYFILHGMRRKRCSQAPKIFGCLADLNAFVESINRPYNYKDLKEFHKTSVLSLPIQCGIKWQIKICDQQVQADPLYYLLCRTFIKIF